MRFCEEFPLHQNKTLFFVSSLNFLNFDFPIFGWNCYFHPTTWCWSALCSDRYFVLRTNHCCYSKYNNGWWSGCSHFLLQWSSGSYFRFLCAVILIPLHRDLFSETEKYHLLRLLNQTVQNDSEQMKIACQMLANPQPNFYFYYECLYPLRSLPQRKHWEVYFFLFPSFLALRFPWL